MKAPQNNVAVGSRRQRAYEMFSSGGHSYGEIAAALGVSRRTACRYVHQQREESGCARDVAVWEERRRLNRSLEIPPDCRASVGALAHYHRNALEAVLTTLTQRQRRTYDAYFLRAATAAEIAHLEGRSPAAIVRRIHRILQRFQQAGIPLPQHPRRNLSNLKRFRPASLSNWNSYSY